MVLFCMVYASGPPVVSLLDQIYHLGPFCSVIHCSVVSFEPIDHFYVGLRKPYVVFMHSATRSENEESPMKYS